MCLKILHELHHLPSTLKSKAIAICFVSQLDLKAKLSYEYEMMLGRFRVCLRSKKRNQKYGNS